MDKEQVFGQIDECPDCSEKMPQIGKHICSPTYKQLQAKLEKLEDLRTTVQINCNPPDDCNDPEVLKTYMRACFEQAMQEKENQNG